MKESLYKAGISFGSVSSDAMSLGVNSRHPFAVLLGYLYTEFAKLQQNHIHLKKKKKFVPHKIGDYQWI